MEVGFDDMIEVGLGGDMTAQRRLNGQRLIRKARR